MEYIKFAIILCLICWSDAKSLEQSLEDLLQVVDEIKSHGDKFDISELKSDLKTYIDDLVDRKSYRKLYADTVVQSLMTEKKLRKQFEIKMTAIEEKRKHEISAIEEKRKREISAIEEKRKHDISSLRRELEALKEIVVNNDGRIEDVQSMTHVEFKSFQNEIDSMKRDVADNKARTSDVKENAELHRSKLNGLLQYVNDELNRTVDNQVKDLHAQLESDKAYTNLKLNDIEETYRTLERLIPHRVAFDARIQYGHSYKDLEPWQTLVFSAVMLNDGDCYSGTTGEFIAPFSGTYAFHVHITGGNNTAMEIQLAKNKGGIFFMYVKGPTYGTDSGSVVVKLRVGDVVKVKKSGLWGQRPFYVHHVFSSFSGFLLYEE